jgi:UDP-N-acetylmuramoylalanine--D-glutamate ligase
MMELRNKNVLILGLGETGLSLVRWLSAQGAHVHVADTRSHPPGLDKVKLYAPEAAIHCGPFSEALLQGIELVAISPGVPPTDPLARRAMAQGIPVQGDIELFAQHQRQMNSDAASGKPKVIAITGANGKTTVTSMVGAMCRAAGMDTAVAGNISPAVLDEMLDRNKQQPEVWVLELSSFQLETTYTLNADAATVLNISEDHLDRHDGMDAYALAKARIFAGQGVQILNRGDERSLSMAIPGRSCISFGLDAPHTETDWGVVVEDGESWLMQGSHRIMPASELQVTGLHNVVNALAALALCRAIDLPLAPLCDALRAFKGLPHRVEKVVEINGVIYYDDSKGTNVGATEAALSGLGKPAVVILGGEGKGQDFSPLKNAVAQHARAVILIGRDADKIEAALQGCGKPAIRASDMKDAVRKAAAWATSGDAVLLSPACASFDMYRNYEHRAQEFMAAVLELQREAVCVSQA